MIHLSSSFGEKSSTRDVTRWFKGHSDKDYASQIEHLAADVTIEDLENFEIHNDDDQVCNIFFCFVLFCFFLFCFVLFFFFLDDGTKFNPSPG